MKNYYDVAIIGGGASGLAAAIELRSLSPELSVVIIEKNDSLGRKIRATGNGRCNITNKKATGYLEIMKWFMRIGLMTRSCDSDLVYPYSESAADVVDLLNETARQAFLTDLQKSARLDANQINSEDQVNQVNPVNLTDIMCNSTVTGISGNGPFEIAVRREIDESSARNGSNDSDFRGKSSKTSNRAASNIEQKIHAGKVILSTGGKAGPEFGTTGDGYKLAGNFGHSIVTPIPVLTGIECENWDKSLAGIRANGIVSLYRDETGVFDVRS